MAKNPFLDIDLGKLYEITKKEPHELPSMPAGPVGRHRLVSVLQHHFGNDFRMNESARKVLSHFDRETEKIKGFIRIKDRIKGKENG